jgi:hypothetical protein
MKSVVLEAPQITREELAHRLRLAPRDIDGKYTGHPYGKTGKGGGNH